MRMSSVAPWRPSSNCYLNHWLVMRLLLRSWLSTVSVCVLYCDAKVQKIKRALSLSPFSLVPLLSPSCGGPTSQATRDPNRHHASPQPQDSPLPDYPLVPRPRIWRVQQNDCQQPGHRLLANSHAPASLRLGWPQQTARLADGYDTNHRTPWICARPLVCHILIEHIL